jgi:hypothetical protein
VHLGILAIEVDFNPQTVYSGYDQAISSSVGSLHAADLQIQDPLCQTTTRHCSTKQVSLPDSPSPITTLFFVPGSETANHYLIACTEYAEDRSQLRRQINSQGILVLCRGTLLGGDITSSPTWSQACRAVGKFISSTQRFGP